MALLLTLAVLAANFIPAMAACDPSNAVVAVISVVATLAVVAIILLGIYLCIRRRRRGAFLKTRKSSRQVNEMGGDTTDGFTNAAFDGNEVALAEQGLSNKLQGSNNNSPNKQHTAGKDGNAKTWASFPKHDQTGVLYRQGSCGSLDENIHSDPEIISVCLESQDIIGLGFNICGNFGQGILVSQVHNRGPAIESGKIKVGDKILSVTVSYENIVYEDALTILSYASPYPVKVTLQKADSGKPRDSTLYKRNHSGGTTEDTPTPDQLNHPLYRSQSLDALRRVQGVKEHSNLPFAAKRAQSEMKPETRKDGSKGKKGDRNSKSFVHDVFDKIAGSISSSRSNSHRRNEMVVSDVVVHNEGDGAYPSSKSTNEKFQMASTSKSSSPEDVTQMSNSATEFASLMDEMLDLKQDKPLSLGSGAETGDEADEPVVISKPSPPNKPERKNKRQESLEAAMSQGEQDNHLPKTENSNVDEFVNGVITSSTATVANSMPPKSSDTEVDEGIIQPSVAKREIKIGDEYVSVDREESSKERKEPMDKKDALHFFSELTPSDLIGETERSSSPEGDEIQEELIEASVAKKDSSIPLPPSDKVKFEDSPKGKANNEKEKEKPKQPALDEDMLERLIAMNSYAPGTQGWAGIQAGGEQGGIKDDFIPNTRTFMAQPLPKEQLHKMLSSDSSMSVDSSRPMSPPSVAYEIRDDVISGRPVAVEINKTKNVTRTSSYNTSLPDSSSSSVESSNTKKSTSVREGSNSYSRHASSKGSNNSYNDNSDNYDTPLAWSGQRLVRAGSFTNIPENNSVSDWTDEIVRNDDSCVQVDDLTDSDSEEVNANILPQKNFHLKDKTIEIKDTRSMRDHSDMSNSATSSSGEATPPYRNGQELGSSPEFTLPTPAIHILSNELSAVGKGNAVSLSLDDSKSHDDVDC